MAKFTGQTDKVEIFQLQSLILDAYWHVPEGYVNGSATLEVRTAYVATGSPLTVTIKNIKGETLEKLSGKIVSEIYRKKITLGPKAAGGIFFEVELPEHHLKAQGPNLRVPASIKLSHPTWKEKATGKDVTVLKREMHLILETTVEGVPENTDGTISIMEKHGNQTHTHVVLGVKAKAGKFTAIYSFDYPRDTQPLQSKDAKQKTGEKYQTPKIFFEAACLGMKILSNEIEFKDGIKVAVKDEHEQLLPKRKVKVTLPDGSHREMESDHHGFVYVDNFHPGQLSVQILPVTDPPTQVPLRPKEEEGGVSGGHGASGSWEEESESTDKVIKKGDHGPVVEELNIRLAGFGGGVPKDVFDDETEKKVKQFQSLYMKMAQPTGLFDVDTAKNMDEFSDKYTINLESFKCKCGGCTGFGNAKFKEDSKKHEYPGMHRSLLWALKGLFSYIKEVDLTFHEISSGYRCWTDNKQHNRESTNHMGKAMDLTFYESKTSVKKKAVKEDCDKVRKLLEKKINGQIRWKDKNKFSMEPSDKSYPKEFVATNWVHIDVREFEKKYLEDRFFCKSNETLMGKKMYELWKELKV